MIFIATLFEINPKQKYLIDYFKIRMQMIF